MEVERPILVVEDSDDDFYATKRTFMKFGSFRLDRCSRGAEVLGHLDRSVGPQRPNAPSLILLDLNLPGKKDGRVVLRELKQHETYRRIPIVVMTTSASPRDISECYEKGAAGYLVKPLDLVDFAASISTLITYWLKTVELPSMESPI